MAPFCQTSKQIIRNTFENWGMTFFKYLTLNSILQCSQSSISIKSKINCLVFDLIVFQLSKIMAALISLTIQITTVLQQRPSSFLAKFFKIFLQLQLTDYFFYHLKVFPPFLFLIHF